MLSYEMHVMFAAGCGNHAQQRQAPKQLHEHRSQITRSVPLLPRTRHKTCGSSCGLLRTLTMHTSLRQWCAAAGALKVMVACAVA